MLDFSRRDTVQKLILLITGILIAMRCFFPVEYYRIWHTGERRQVSLTSIGMRRYLAWRFSNDERFKQKVDEAIDSHTPLVNTTKTAFHCIGIAVIGGVLFYILGGKKKGKD